MDRRRATDGEFTLGDAREVFDEFNQLDPRWKPLVVIAAIVALIVLIYIWHRSQYTTTAVPGGYVHLLLGNPSHADSAPADRDNYLMAKPYFAVCYNDGRGIPNWVSWRVQAEDLGQAPRKQVFDPDATLPAGFNVVTQRDYSGSGFDRGHMCPHSDRAGSEEMSYATFVMTNVIPQAPNVNRKAWEQLESYGRELVAREHDRLYIIAGPAGQGGRGSRGAADTLAGGHVVVPAECWKIIVVVPEAGGEDDAAKMSAGTRVITVDMPNDQDAVGEEWAPFRTSPAEVERKTGLHFFDRLRPDIADAWRQKTDRETIPPPRPRHYEE